MKIQAPYGCGGFTVGKTVVTDIPADGILDVSADIADILMNHHGFTDPSKKPPDPDVISAAAQLPHDIVPVPRSLIVHLLHTLDFTVASDDMPAENLVGLLEQAAAAYATKPPEPQQRGGKRKEAA